MLKESRLSKGLTQKDVAEKLNSDRSYISRLENTPHRCNPSLHTLLLLSLIIGADRTLVFEYFAASKEKHSVNLMRKKRERKSKIKKKIKGRIRRKRKNKTEQQ